jgi:hypothetical protein
MSSSTANHAARDRARDPILLCGSTRSGTTLLSLMLGHHPEIAFVGELEWIWDFPDRTNLTERHAPLPESYRRFLRTHRGYSHSRLQLEDSLTLDELPASMLGQMRDRTDPLQRKPRFGCQVHRHYREAFEQWPEARVIHIVRDGRDVCASWLKLGWLGNAYRGALRWRDSLDEWEQLENDIPAAQRIELRFEDLIREPAQQLERLCAFLGVRYDDAMLRYHEDTTYEPIDPRQASKWRTQLTERDVRVFEAVAGQALQRHGYAPSGAAPYAIKPWTKAWLDVENTLRHHQKRADMLGPRLWLSDVLARRLGPRWLKERVRMQLNAFEAARLQ